MEANEVNTIKEENNENNLSPVNGIESPKIRKSKTRARDTENTNEEDLIYENVKNSRFKQQRLPAWRPVPTINSIIAVFSTFGIIFIILGIILLKYTKKVKIIYKDYFPDICNNENENCEFTIDINEELTKPVYVYYQLDGFYQNSRRYINSKSSKQLKGLSSKDEEGECSNAQKNSEMEMPSIKTSIDGTDLNDNNIAVPCGLMAKSFFNDTFQFKNGSNDETIEIDQGGIAFKRDTEIYKNEYKDLQWQDITDEHFLVWMRPSGLPDPRKLWGKIEKDLHKEDKIKVTVTNNYKLPYIKKKLVLSNTTKFGGRNMFLAISYIVAGCLCLCCVIIFFVGYKYQMNKEKNQ